ncbi:MAG: PD40 domain-containing protein [Sphingobacteriaceae bacterium]|nr:PD40 domain-containing protein [Sphingobacteriaceae bacterium]
MIQNFGIAKPTIAADGLTLYFASDRPGGYGGIDIYVTHKNPKNGQWSVPENLGPV